MYRNSPDGAKYSNYNGTFIWYDDNTRVQVSGGYYHNERGEPILDETGMSGLIFVNMYEVKPPAGTGGSRFGPERGADSGLGEATFWDSFGVREVDGWMVDREGKFMGSRAPIGGAVAFGPGGAVKAGQTTWTVYKSVTKNGGVYWGMTKNFAKRVAQHGNRFVSITEEYIGISTRGAARGIEQLKIDAAGGIRNLENAINSIGPKNPKMMEYYREAIKYLKGS